MSTTGKGKPKFFRPLIFGSSRNGEVFLCRFRLVFVMRVRIENPSATPWFGAIGCKLWCGRSGRNPPAQGRAKIIDAGPPPSDAIVLFNGEDLAQWISQKDGGAARWEIKDGVATVKRNGTIVTRQCFGDCQLHIEWATPEKVKGEGQGRGNSGVLSPEPL
jgi:hypothetical protein